MEGGERDKRRGYILVVIKYIIAVLLLLSLSKEKVAVFLLMKTHCNLTRRKDYLLSKISLINLFFNKFSSTYDRILETSTGAL